MASRLLIAALALLGLSAAAAHAAPLEVKFCPEPSARSYPLSTPQVQSLVLHNVAVINRGPDPVTLSSIEISLDASGKAVDRRDFDPAAIAAQGKRSVGAKAGGMIKVFGFQFCEGVLIMGQVFAWRGARDAVTVTASGEAKGAAVTASASQPIDGATTKTQMLYPLKGRSVVVVAGTPQGGHRWAIPEQFAVDIVAFGDGSSTFRGQGTRFEDYYIYGRPVQAVADGTVAVVIADQAENPAAMRQPGESLDAYGERMGGIQAALVAKGDDAIPGNVVIIDHGNGDYSVSAHLKPGSITVKVGQKVAAGTVIGLVGSSGNSTEPHLHFQVCDRPSGLHCVGKPASFIKMELPYADGPRAIQAGDIIDAQ
jgi:murein DD-endopeptidase MepM/ murein hydrolase activator NlpD